MAALVKLVVTSRVVTLRYGADEAQVGALHLPDVVRPPVVCVLHGGFWRMPYGRDETAPMAAALARRGIAAWNLEYRRLGAPGGGWPGTFDDVGVGDHVDFAELEGVGHFEHVDCSTPACSTALDWLHALLM